MSELTKGMGMSEKKKSGLIDELVEFKNKHRSLTNFFTEREVKSMTGTLNSMVNRLTENKANNESAIHRTLSWTIDIGKKLYNKLANNEVTQVKDTVEAPTNKETEVEANTNGGVIMDSFRELTENDETLYQLYSYAELNDRDSFDEEFTFKAYEQLLNEEQRVTNRIFETMGPGFVTSVGGGKEVEPGFTTSTGEKFIDARTSLLGLDGSSPLAFSSKEAFTELLNSPLVNSVLHNTKLLHKTSPELGGEFIADLKTLFYTKEAMGIIKNAKGSHVDEYVKDRIREVSIRQRQEREPQSLMTTSFDYEVDKSKVHASLFAEKLRLAEEIKGVWKECVKGNDQLDEHSYNAVSYFKNLTGNKHGMLDSVLNQSPVTDVMFEKNSAVAEMLVKMVNINAAIDAVNLATPSDGKLDAGKILAKVEKENEVNTNSSLKYRLSSQNIYGDRKTVNISTLTKAPNFESALEDIFMGFQTEDKDSPSRPRMRQ